MSTQGKLTCEQVNMQDTLAREYISTQDMLAREHVSTQSMGARKARWHVRTLGTQFSRLH